jgi:hypothetical protein
MGGRGGGRGKHAEVCRLLLDSCLLRAPVCVVKMQCQHCVVKMHSDNTV